MLFPLLPSLCKQVDGNLFDVLCLPASAFYCVKLFFALTICSMWEDMDPHLQFSHSTKFLLEVQHIYHDLFYIQEEIAMLRQCNCSERLADLVVLRAGCHIVWILADPSPMLG